MRLLIKKKHTLWRKYQNTKNQDVWKEFKTIRNAVRKESRKAVQNENLAVAKSCKNNPKKFWKHVKMKTSTYGTISNIKHVDHQGNDVMITDDTEKANVFAKYFPQFLPLKQSIVLKNSDVIT